ncbi:hypothetical protein R3P38DRAFT_3269584 [Favolaschia claudopus]|uniref:Uncharacterized protein n=1 Tax=Favolaschia claudopus TaxID=2862362 RepID=A0AAW0BHK5_9AGAR
MSACNGVFVITKGGLPSALEMMIMDDTGGSRHRRSSASITMHWHASRGRRDGTRNESGPQLFLGCYAVSSSSALARTPSPASAIPHTAYSSESAALAEREHSIHRVFVSACICYTLASYSDRALCPAHAHGSIWSSHKTDISVPILPPPPPVPPKARSLPWYGILPSTAFVPISITNARIRAWLVLPYRRRLRTRQHHDDSLPQHK